jgi:hypothetical protein
MVLNSALNLVFPIKWGEKPDPDDAESTITVPLVTAYHIPISQAVFEANWRIISATSAMMLKKGVGPSVVRIATLALKDAGRADAADYGLPEGASIEAGGSAVPLLAELRRLTTILAPGPNGYEQLPVNIAIARNVIDEDDWQEAESSLVFFTCGLSLPMRQRKAASANLLASTLMGSITSSPVTEYVASLPTSTPTDASPPPAIPQ